MQEPSTIISDETLTGSKEFENFDRTMTDLLKVPHSEIKAKLDAEKAEKKKRKKRKPKKTSASGYASGDKE